MRGEENELQVGCMQARWTSKNLSLRLSHSMQSTITITHSMLEIHITTPASDSIHEINLCACKKICTVASTPFIQVNIYTCMQQTCCVCFCRNVQHTYIIPEIVEIVTVYSKQA